MSRELIGFTCEKHVTAAEMDYGNCGYSCFCCECGKAFTGHKGDATCPKCISIAEAKEAVIEAAKLWRSVVDPATTADVQLCWLVDALIQAAASGQS